MNSGNNSTGVHPIINSASSNFSPKETALYADDEIIPRSKLTKFIQLYAGSEKLDPQVVSSLSEIGHEFVANLVEEACQLASLKESKCIEPQDIQFLAEKNYGIRIPCLPASNDSMQSLKTASLIMRPDNPYGGDAHIRRLAQIRHHILTCSTQQPQINK